MPSNYLLSTLIIKLCLCVAMFTAGLTTCVCILLLQGLEQLTNKPFLLAAAWTLGAGIFGGTYITDIFSHVRETREAIGELMTDPQFREMVDNKINDLRES